MIQSIDSVTPVKVVPGLSRKAVRHTEKKQHRSDRHEAKKELRDLVDGVWGGYEEVAS